MGSVCINRSSIHKVELQYPLIKRIQKFSPNRQNALEKPFTHSELIEDVYEVTELEGILKDLEENKKFTEDKILTDDVTVQKEQVRQHIAVNQAIKRLNEIVTQIQFQVELQEKSSVILRTNYRGSDTQTLKGILKSDQSKSKSKSKSKSNSKYNNSVNRLKQAKTQKKVSFESRVLNRKSNKIYI